MGKCKVLIHKLLNPISYALALVFSISLGSCTNEEIKLQPGEEKPIESPPEGITGKYFFQFSLGQAGTTSVTKAETGPTFDIGTANEYAIVDGWVYVYAGKGKANEGDMICVTRGHLGPLSTTASSSSTAEFSTQPIQVKNIELEEFEYDENEEYYALVILNANSEFEYPSINSNSGQSFSTWALKAQSSNMLLEKVDGTTTTTYITMTNATGQGRAVNADGSFASMAEGFTPTTLVRIQPGDIKLGEFDSSHKTFTNVYVQRNVAKVMVKPKSNANNQNILTGEDKLTTVGDFTVQINISGWMLDVKNKTSYPVMNVNGLEWNKNFHYSSQSTEFKRAYWAKDPNYNSNTDDFEDGTNKSFAVYIPEYCLENTMEPKNMIQNQTTRAIIKCRMTWEVSKEDDNKQQKWWGSNEFTGREHIVMPDDYIWAGEPTSTYPALPTTDHANDGGFNNNFNEPGGGFFKIGIGANANLWDRLHIEQTLISLVKEKLGEETSVTVDWKDVPGGTYENLNALLTLKAGEKIYTDIEINELISGSKLQYAATTPILFYKDKFMYYVVRIRHFADDEGGDDSVAWDGMTIKGEDGKYQAFYTDKHLGRYGVVRNNFYEIVVNSIHNLGSPEIPDPTDETDDVPEDYYLDFSINIKDWSKRQVDFVF